MKENAVRFHRTYHRITESPDVPDSADSADWHTLHHQVAGFL